MKRKWIFTALSKERKCRVEELVRALETGETAQAKEHLSWIETFDNLQRYRTNERRWVASIVVGLCCAGIALVAVTLRSPSSLAYIETWAQEVGISTSGTVPVLLDVNADSIWVSEVAQLQSVTLAVAPEENKSLGISARGRGLHLDSLSLNGTARLTISGDSTSLALFIWSQGIRGRLDFTKARLHLGEGTKEVSLMRGAEPYDLAFVGGLGEALPVEIRIMGLTGWKIPDIVLTKICFVAESPEGSGWFASSLDSGRITLAESGDVTTIRSGDSLSLDLKEVSRCSFSGSTRQVHSVLEARVGELSHTSRTVRSDLMPRMVDVVLHNDMLRVLWGALVFVWGIAYGAWRSFQK